MNHDEKVKRCIIAERKPDKTYVFGICHVYTRWIGSCKDCSFNYRGRYKINGNEIKDL